LKYASDDAKAVRDELNKQKSRGYYRDVEAKLLLNKSVTRESIIEAIDDVRNRAVPSDVVIIFMAGHGVEAYSRYYFLPHPATQESVTTRALGMSDLNDALTRLHDNVKNVVVMLDTCDAGAMEIGARGLRPPDFDPTREIRETEGLFVFGASKPGEASTEDPRWRHGAFTLALLEALRGKADQNDDGWLQIDEVYQYVDSRVRELTKGSQHPFRRMLGTGLVLVATRDQAAPPKPLDGDTTTMAPVLPVQPNAVVVVPFENLSSKPEDQRAQELRGLAIKSDFEIRLRYVTALDVQLPDFPIENNENLLPTLRTHGIGLVVRGEFFISGGKIRINAKVVDTVTRRQVGGGSVEGSNDDGRILEMQTEVIKQTLQSMKITVTAAEADELKKERNNSVSALEMLLQADGATGGASAAPDAPPTRSPALPPTQSGVHGGIGGEWFVDLLWPPACAADEESEIRKLLDDYRRAFTEKDLGGLAKFYVSFPPSQLEAMRAYLNNATDLNVEIDEISVTMQGGNVSVAYTRRDYFTEKATGRKINLEVRLKKTLVREEGKWKIAGS
jgi:TolB-like protein/ketosteroid isomerase-like protein